MTSVNVHCPRSQSAQVYLHGQPPKGHDRFRCRDCHRLFQLICADEARKTWAAIEGLTGKIFPQR